MREGSLEPPIRHPLAWHDPDFYDAAKIDAEMRRVFDICHGCRRCFNLCDSFPRLFDLVDQSPSEELDTVKSEDFKPVVDACTLCDMCFMTKCPYVPPHEYALDFPHLMLRYRAAEFRNGKVGAIEQQLTKTDRNGKLGAALPTVTNWASNTGNKMTRGALERVANVDRNAALPKFHGKTLTMRAKDHPPALNRDAPAFGRKAAIFATCFANYNNPAIGEAALAVLARNGVETRLEYPGCCGMPQLENGNIEAVAEKAKRTAAAFGPLIDAGHDVVALVPSCALMMKFEWPLILPGDAAVKKLADATYDVSEYVVDIAKKEGLAPGMTPLSGGVALHIACHARAQNMGQKAAEMLRLLPGIDLAVIERCAGHGGSWGVMKGNFETAIKIGKPVARQAAKSEKRIVASECPLAGMHILQGMERIKDATVPGDAPHPIQLIARAYGLETE
ncbi:MAG: heterodisulfide reductase-related iron-sulfur binding cluster [Rhodospirillaceae bacterium]|nr:heterodisulfide reductase-related iron-sulfur binding cluster [Rhodospirillaceae bacterium]